jgi:hypothetical protein
MCHPTINKYLNNKIGVLGIASMVLVTPPSVYTYFWEPPDITPEFMKKITFDLDSCNLVNILKLLQSLDDNTNMILDESIKNKTSQSFQKSFKLLIWK